ncbi:hypothetical protein THAOC_29776, partial [Thalassiosira oceanica]
RNPLRAGQGRAAGRRSKGIRYRMEPVGPDAGTPSQDDGVAAGGADDRSAEAATEVAIYSERLLSEGHERWEGDRCPICFLFVGLPVIVLGAFNDQILVISVH